MIAILRRLNPWSSLAGLPKLAYWLALATFINRAGTMVLPFMLLYLTRYLDWEPSDGAAILFLYGVGSVIAGPLAGKLCDRYGCGRVVCCSLGVSSLVMLLFPLAHAVPRVAIATALMALSGGAFRPANLAIQAFILAPEQRLKGFTLNRLAANAGMSVGPATGGLLASIWFPAIFIVDGITALVGSLILIKLVWSIGVRPEREEDRNSAEGPLADRRYLALLAGSFLVTLGFFQLDSTLPLTVVNGLGMSEREFGLIFTVNTIFILLFEVAINDRTSLWEPSRALLIGALLMGFGLGATALISDLKGLLALVLFWTVGEIVFFPAQLAQVARIAPEAKVGAYMGYLTSVGGLAFALAPMVGIPLYSNLGQVGFWPLVSLICLLGGLLVKRSSSAISQER